MTNEEAIDYLVGIKKYYTEDKDFGYYGDEYHGLTVKEKEALCLAISVLNHSATDINVATKDGDMVYRQDAIDAVLKRDANCGIDNAEVLKDLPSAQPEIIRCRNCRHYEWMSNRIPEEQTWFCHNWNAETGEDDYCSYAERREDGQTT